MPGDGKKFENWLPRYDRRWKAPRRPGGGGAWVVRVGQSDTSAPAPTSSPTPSKLGGGQLPEAEHRERHPGGMPTTPPPGAALGRLFLLDGHCMGRVVLTSLAF